ncbi:histidine phosphatase family protein [Lentibacter algarum]|nr:histidine phosphatase family protein [Lentibacter algarum]
MLRLSEQKAQLVLLRHAPTAGGLRLCGRTDAPADLSAAPITDARSALEGITQIVRSPALRCAQTAEALWPDASIAQDARLWEQDFGDHDGMLYADLPDLGPMTNAQLAAYTPPNGESFTSLCARVHPALNELAAVAQKAQSPVAIVAHAGVIRAAIASTMQQHSEALAFEVDTLSCTRLRVGPTGAFSVIEVNKTWG